MQTTEFYTKNLARYEKNLLGGVWPLPTPGVPDFFLDLGIDPSMSSSGICGVLRTSEKVIACQVLNHKTSPHEPTPLRLSSVVVVSLQLVKSLLANLKPPSKVHITILFEEPPTNMSSSAWLFALNQMLWLGFGPEDFKEELALRHTITLHQLAIGNTQLKQLYFVWSEKKKLGLAYNEIKKSKSNIVRVIKSVVEPSILFPFLPKRYNNDVAEAIAMACCAGACSAMCDADVAPAEMLYDFIPTQELFTLMVSKKVNKHNERMGWIYRPLTHSFGWDSAWA